MPAFKDPSFQQRQDAAARARNDALAKLKAKPPVDEAVLAERTAKRLAREEAEAEKREAARVAGEGESAARPPELTEAERKAARDARYAARKNRKAAR